MQQLGKLILAQPDGSQQEYTLEQSQITLGRGATCDIALADARVSRSHARVECSSDGCTLIDLGSGNGTLVNGAPVTRARLAPGDLIRLGDSTLRYEVAPAAPEPEIRAIDTEAELDATLAQSLVPMTLTNNAIPRLVVHTPSRTWDVPLVQESLSIGRHPGNDLVLDQARASRSHARIERVGDGFRLRDLNSTNGTWLGEQRIDQRQLRSGDTVRIGDARLIYKAGFVPDDLTLAADGRAASASSVRTAHPPVVFVPGMMGSQLWRGSERIWPNTKLMLTQPELYAVSEDDGIEARGIVGEMVIVPNLLKQQRYGRLAEYLEEALGYERGKDLLEFGYDFRRDLRLAARRLAQTIDGWTVTGPITLIAHSMGTIVSRYYVERLGGKRKVGRLILLGGPHAGYPKAVSHLLSGPDLLPFGLLGDRLRETLITYPSIYQILPHQPLVTDQSGQPLDMLTDTGWLWPEQQPFLVNARSFRRELGAVSSVPTISIFGYGQKTAAAVRVERSPDGVWQKVDFEMTEQGDASLPASSAVLSGSEIHPVQQHHGSLYVDNDVKMRLKLELTG